MTHNHTPHIRTEKLTAIIGGCTLFTDLNLTINTATRLAIVGENGRGKTTLLHLLAGETEPHSGTITRAGTSALVAQTLETPAHNTVGDLIEHALSETHAALRRFDAATEALKHDTPEAAAEYAQALEEVVALDAWDAERKIQMALEGLGACTDRTKVLNTLFVGQRYRVRLAVLLASSTDILLLDEPTNHLDDAALGFLATALKNRSGGVALVSHDRQLLHDVAGTFLDLDPTMDSIPRTHGGGYDNWRAAKHKERITWKQQYEHHIEEKQRLEQAVQAARARLTTGWRPAKGTNRYQRASKTDNQLHTLDRQVRALAQLDIPVPKPPQELAFPSPPSHEALPSCMPPTSVLQVALHPPTSIFLPAINSSSPAPTVQGNPPCWPSSHSNYHPPPAPSPSTPAAPSRTSPKRFPVGAPARPPLSHTNTIWFPAAYTIHPVWLPWACLTTSPRTSISYHRDNSAACT